MGHCSLRSLLFAAVVISNCITWTASRHHYTHNVHGHRSRHRRQGAGLFLPSSYVIPGDEGSGAWGEWGEVSPCSRTCGGGVASQKRICLEVGSDGQPRCTGGDTKYFSCETQDCPDGSKDFRAQQCSEYDDATFKGIKYSWVPYTKGPNPCELNCMPRGERFYYRHQTKVIDGTRCNEESFDVCVSGSCQAVGCDFMLGSSAREDKCRECRGNGTNCHTISALLDSQDLRTGYNDILLIPQGATSIVIEEVRPSSNYLAIRATNNTYYLNGEYHIDFPRSIEIAGATWYYERSSNGLPSPDKLRSLGPTYEPLFLSLLLQEPNVGVQYEYSVPKSAAPPPNQQYDWVHEEFTPCTATCGGGIQTRNVTCRSREELEIVDESLCNDAFKPVTNQTCNTTPCPARWVTGEWEPCSKLCGEGGSRSRKVHCEKIFSNGYPSVVGEKECFELLGPKPPLFEECNQNATCPIWFTGPWKPCDKLCDEGKQTRQVVCYQKTDNKIEVLDDKQCVDEKPAAEQPCMIHPCVGLDWMVSDWVGCDTCLSKVRTRTAVCATKDSRVMNDSFCEYHPKPHLEEPCDKTKLPACQIQWYATQWSNCSTNCGKGVQTRRVFCGLFDGASVIVVDNSRCEADEKYNDTKPCEVTECPEKWYAGPWSACDRPCGGGQKTRRVDCLDGDRKPSNSCRYGDILESTERCNDIPCDKDETIPLSPSSPSIMDEDEEDCEDEDYPEAGAEEDWSLTSVMFSDSPSSGFTELESEFTTDTGSGFGTSFSEGSGYGTTDSTLSSDEDFTTDTSETGSEEDTSSTETEIGDTGSTDLSSSSGATEPTVIKDTASTDSASPKSTIESNSTETSVTDSTDSSTASDVDYDYIETTVSGATESSVSTSGSDGTTESGATKSSDETTETGSSESDATDDTTVSGATASSVSGATESTASGSTESSVSGETLSTVSGASESTDTSGSTETDYIDETESTVTSETETIESLPTDETTETEITDASGSTDETSSTEAVSTESSGSTEVSFTDAVSTETSVSTEGGSTKLSSETAESESTTISGSTEATSEGGSTKSEATEPSGSTVSSETESVTGSTEESVTTESGSTGPSGTTEISESGSTETTVSGSTETTESGATETTVSGSTEITEVSETTETGFTESTETTASSEFGSTTESATESSTTESGSTELVTDETGTTVSGTLETGSTETGSSEGTTESISSVSGEESTDKTVYNWASTIEEITTRKQKQCKRRVSKCAKSTFGCCPDKRTAAKGPFDEGCPFSRTCAETEHGCCPDGVSPARGAHHEGCPVEDCAATLFGCCKSDNKTAAEGNEQEGCPPPPPACKSSKHGCCKDGKTQATGPKGKGCPESEKPKTTVATTDDKYETTTALLEGSECSTTEFGCCPDGVSAAAGVQLEGCDTSCNSSTYGCCPDGETPAHGYDNEGCCLLSPFGCCPDNFKPAEGPHLEGCGCEHSHYGCCPDNETLATGPENEGCGCQYKDYGCCPDRHTPASGPDFAGCDCHTYQFGCCDDGVTVAKGPGMQGCLCIQSEFGCCEDEKTPAAGPDKAGCDCSTSKFGCCPDGETSAQGTKFLGCTDKPENRQAACGLENDRGSCTNYTVYWFYDVLYGGCSRFWYGGCEGNGNRFLTKDECEDTCVHPAPEETCNLPMVKGACTGYNPRWYYDASREHCAQFIFGGCLGNDNNFESRELCQKRCEPARSEDQCALPIDRGVCSGNFLRWGWNAESGRCEQFIWGGCEGNTNRFSTEAACLHRCNPPGVPKLKPICTLPAVTGECADYTEKWYYDTAIKRCRQFYYGGCGGNENRFSTELECENQCSELKTTTPPPLRTTPADLCTLPSQTGECDRYTFKWFFDSSISRCRQFYYGGCGGNDNRFESEQACEARCGLRTTTTVAPQTPVVESRGPDQGICFLEVDGGPCSEQYERWAYDAARGACVPFTFGGCGGNQNNFPSQDYCHQYCGSTQDVCQLPMLTGNCSDSIMQWFYDASSDSCSQFTFSGCGGNDNRFESLEACEQRCRSGPEPAQQITTTTATPANITSTPPGDEVPPACRVLPTATEECAGEGTVWYFDEGRRACVPYSNAAAGYSCRRTGVYRSEEACRRTCADFRNIEVCRFSKNPGTSCGESAQKYYYDQAVDSCLAFTYGGCDGSPNRFSSVEECEDVCKFEKDPCKRRPKEITCSDYLVAWFFDEGRDECYEYYTCDHNDATRLASKDECEGQCRRAPPAPRLRPATPAPAPAPQPEDECTTPRSFEGCNNSTVKFYYDAERSECVQSLYGDCGHPNSYSSEEACLRACGAFQGVDACRYPLEVGSCNDAIPKFYWKLSSGRCEPFTYGGCGGGPNRFSTVEECQAICSGTGPEPACLEPLDMGEECEEAATRRWHYSEQDAQCRVFLHLGCGGNRNSFHSFRDCSDACHTQTIFEGGNEVLPSCDQFNAECEALHCEFGVQRMRGSDGCERCSCVQVEVDCAPLQQECEVLKCAYGVKRTRAPDGCERCTCLEHPCASKECPAGERCVTSPYRDPITQDFDYVAECRVVNKPGSCPLEVGPADEQCRRECNDDADCVGVGKCCTRGCRQLCLEPATPTNPAPVTTTYAPELPQAPEANTATEPEVNAEEGGKATLRCLFHGNPPPKITWRRGEITIDGDVGRYRLLSDGALEIVSLYRNDSGVYICVAENVHGVSRQEVRLQVNDPESSPAGISGDANAVVTGELGLSLNIRCLAYGYPAPSIYWYRGRNMLPYSSELYEARENVLQIRRLEIDTLGEYACQAFNGVGKPAVWSVEVRAYQPDEHTQHELLVPRDRTVEITPAQPRTLATTTLAPEIDVPVWTAAVHTRILFEQTTQAVGGDLSLPCDVDGYPLPEVYWTKDNVRLSPDARTQITESRLIISGLRLEDSGEYGCHARNEYSSHSSTIQITVQGVTVPVHCTDNPFFADCKLIVRSKFCNHQYYSRFCCASCVKAGQLNALEVGAQADEAWKRKK